MQMKHLYRRYTPREWLIVLLLVCLSGYVVHNERRAGIIIHDQLLNGKHAELQTQLIQINRERVELLHEMMFGAHRLPMDAPPFPDSMFSSEESMVALEKESE